MPDLMTIADMAAVLQVPHRALVDRITKRADFPRPALVLGLKNKRWTREAFEGWVNTNIAKNLR